MTAVHEGPGDGSADDVDGGGAHDRDVQGTEPVVVTPLPAAVRGPVLREDALNYTPTSRSVTLARHRAERLVTEWGHTAHAADTGLIVSELGANALLHGGLRDRLFQVRLVLTEDILRIEVSDPCGDRPLRPRSPGTVDTFGRGLTVVDHLAHRWGAVPRIVGKTVFAELALSAGA